MLGGQLPQGEGSLLISEIRFVTNTYLVLGWRGGMGVYIDSYITSMDIIISLSFFKTSQLIKPESSAVDPVLRVPKTRKLLK